VNDLVQKSSISELLSTATQYLLSISSTPRLDVEIFQRAIQRRAQGMPVAYIVGYKEFWSLNLEVTPDTLIPRPETELLVECVLNIFPNPIPSVTISTHSSNSAITQSLSDTLPIRIVDLGTGSGAIAWAIANERPEWEVWAVDKSTAALCVAQRNARHLHVENITFAACDWCNALPRKYFHCVVSNPPYIDPQDHCLQDLNLQFEPITALTAEEGGLQDIKNIISQAREVLLPGGFLLLEHGADQCVAVLNLLGKKGYSALKDYSDLAGHARVAVGRHDLI
jgi:release factor glutamine methyltransferase